MMTRAVAQPSITIQPLSRTNNVGDNAQFTVTATGSGTLTYQWQLNSSDIPGATTSTLNVSVTDVSKAGNYRVLVSDTSNLTNTSSVATLVVPHGERSKITQWNFNSVPSDSNTGTGTTTPSLGSGSVAQIGGVTQNQYNSGSASDPDSSGTDNSSRRWNGFTQSIPNKSGGVRYSVSTVGYQNIAVSGELWIATRSSAYWRGQYTTNGTDWVDRGLIDRRAAFLAGYLGFVYFTDDLSGIEGVNNNANFAYRVVAEHQVTATGSGVAAYVPADPNDTYNNTGLFGWDMFTVLGTVDDGTTQPTISTQPESQTNYVGSTATFTVTASGGSLKYFWRFEEQNIINETNASLVITNLELTDAGNYTVVITNSSGSITSAVAVLTVESAPPPGDRYWSADGAAQGGTGTWDASTPNHWGLSTSGPFSFPWNNNNSDTAFFNSPAGAVTLGDDVAVNKINVSLNGYVMNGTNTINFGGTDPGVFISGSGSVQFNCKLNATVLNKTGTGQIFLNNSGNTVGKYVVSGGGTLAATHGDLGAAPATLVPDFITLDGGNFGIEGTRPTLSATKGIYLGSSGQNNIGAKTASPQTITFAQPITGPGGLRFPSGNFGQGNAYGGNLIAYIFNNPANDYQGSTTVARGELRLGANEVLPDTTTLIINGGGSGSRGWLGVNGKSETVDTLVVDGAFAQVHDVNLAGVLNVTNLIDVRQSGGGGNGTNGIYCILGGSGNLVKTTTGVVELAAPNIYSGTTTISDGTLVLTNAGAILNSPSITIAAGATLDVAGRTDGKLTLSAAQTLIGGGTVSGGISLNGKISPGSSVGALSTGAQTWNGGGAYDWEIASATGVEGSDWDTLNITGDLEIQATSENKFTIRLKSLNGTEPGNIANFNNDTSASWSIAIVGGSVQNFAADKFIVDASNISNDLAGGEFLIEAGAGVSIRFTNNHPPVATAANLSRPRGASWKIKVADLLASNTSDADGHTRALVNVGVDTAPIKGTVMVANGYILYSPTDANSTDADTFSFRVKDLAPYRAGDTVREAVANIQLTVMDVAGMAQEISTSEGSVIVKFSGIPNFRYDVERATDASFTENVTVLDTITAPANGQFSITDDNPPSPTAFYRLKYNPL